MEFASLKPRRVLETVIETLEAPILNGSFKQGEKLPSEEQLALQLGVGRRAVREALKVLETKGLVEVQMGVGTVVKRNDLDHFLTTLSQNVSSYLHVNRADAKHVMQLRMLLEGAALEHLARSDDGARTERLADLVRKQREALAANDFQAYQDYHFRFHHEIVDALDNPVISMLYQQVMAMMRSPMQRAGSLPERTAQSIRDHEQILAAAQNRSAHDVRQVLQAHLADFMKAMQEQDEQTA